MYEVRESPGRASPLAPRPLRRMAALGACCALLLSAWSLGGCGGRETPPAAAYRERPAVERVEGLSGEQSRKVGELGYPDHFFISIDPYSGDRIERWSYLSAGKALEFDNGRLMGEENLEEDAPARPPTALRPQDFASQMTPEEARALLGKPLLTREAKEGLMPDNVIFVFEDAVLLFSAGRLIGVDTRAVPPQLPMP